jgi:hypothetical protein
VNTLTLSEAREVLYAMLATLVAIVTGGISVSTNHLFNPASTLAFSLLFSVCAGMSIFCLCKDIEYLRSP